MKALVCELCGGNDLVKDGEYFICQHCGTKYTLEEAKKLLIEGVVKIDSSDTMHNYIDMAKQALECNKGASAYDYINKALEIDTRNAKTWLLKIEAIAHIGTLANPMIDEIIQAGKNAILYASDHEKMRHSVYVEYLEIASQILSLCAIEYSKTAELDNEIKKYPTFSLTKNSDIAKYDLPTLKIYINLSKEAIRLTNEIFTDSINTIDLYEKYKLFVKSAVQSNDALKQRIIKYSSPDLCKEYFIKASVLKQNLVTIYTKLNPIYWDIHKDEKEDLVNRKAKIHDELSNNSKFNEMESLQCENSTLEKKINETDNQISALKSFDLKGKMTLYKERQNLLEKKDSNNKSIEKIKAEFSESYKQLEDIDRLLSNPLSSPEL